MGGFVLTLWLKLVCPHNVVWLQSLGVFVSGLTRLSTL